jgi:hypothetical protein
MCFLVVDRHISVVQAKFGEVAMPGVCAGTDYSKTGYTARRKMVWRPPNLL